MRLSLVALGVVFGDISTSPLYAFRESFIGAHRLPVDQLHVYGVLYRPAANTVRDHGSGEIATCSHRTGVGDLYQIGITARRTPAFRQLAVGYQPRTDPERVAQR